jgi:DNA polymerase-3 subunit delta'
VARHVLESALREKGVAEPQARLLVRLSGGRVGWVLDASGDNAVLNNRQRDLDQMIQLLGATRVERLDFAWEISRKPDASRTLLELWIVWWRDLLLMHNQGQDHVINIDRSDELGWLASRSTMPQVRLALDALQSAAAQLEANVNARLAWEGLMLNLPHFQMPPRQLGEQVGAGEMAPTPA